MRKMISEEIKELKAFFDEANFNKINIKKPPAEVRNADLLLRNSLSFLPS